MRQAIAILTIASVLVAVATAMGGWPGTSVWLALPAALILGAALSHIIDAWLRGTELRLLFSISGILLGTFASMFSVLLMAAANAPSDVDFVGTATIDAPSEEVWALAGEPTSWGRWNAWMAQIEPTTAGPLVQGAEYRTVLAIGGSDVPATHTVTALEPPRRLAWHVALPPGSALDDVREEVVVEPHGGKTRVTYRLRYHIPTAMGRAVHAIVFHNGLRALVQESATGLADLFAAEQPAGAQPP